MNYTSNEKINAAMSKDKTPLKNKKLWLLDMDGTIFIDNDLISGALDMLSQIKENGGRYVFMSNNSSKSVDDYIKKLSGMGIEVDRDSFYISSQAAAKYIKTNYPGKKVYCMGTQSLVSELKRENINVYTENTGDIDIVLLGYDTELNYKKLVDICQIMQPDTVYIATNPDFVCPAKPRFLPDCGAMSRMLEYALHRLPKFLGKPHEYMIDDLMEKFHYSKEETVIVGDRLYTDIACAKNSNIESVCVLSGEATICDIIESNIVADYIVDSVKDIYKNIQ